MDRCYVSGKRALAVRVFMSLNMLQKATVSMLSADVCILIAQYDAFLRLLLHQNELLQVMNSYDCVDFGATLLLTTFPTKFVLFTQKNAQNGCCVRNMICFNLNWCTFFWNISSIENQSFANSQDFDKVKLVRNKF